MLEFKKYSSIENSFNKEFLEKIREFGFDKQTFVVQEKVHGSNFSFLTDGIEIRCAKRTDFLAEDEKFYDYPELLERYKERVIQMFNLTKSEFPELETLTIFGEMFGGNYPHPDVQKHGQIVQIQKGVFYAPIHEFYGFDVKVNNIYLNVDKANELFEKADFLYAKTLFQGDFESCLKYPNAFQSHIAAWLNLPEIKDNICEGVVIRPIQSTFFPNGERVLIKNKNEKFAEKKSFKNRPPKPKPEYSSALMDLCTETESYITENRLNNVISKIGEVSVPKDFGKIMGLFAKDAVDDFAKDFHVQYEALEKEERKVLNRHVNKLASEFIVGYYKSR